MTGSSRHHKLVPRTRHTHAWCKAWLEKHGWEMSSVTVPTREEILAGSKDKGTLWMRREQDGQAFTVGIPGARQASTSLSRNEWAQFMRDLSYCYNMWGVPPPRAHHRMWSKKGLA